LSRATFSRWFGDLAGPLLSVAFPAGCRLCDRLLLNASTLPVCDLCLSSFKRLTAELCPLCGQALAAGEMLGEESDLCRSCQERPYAFNVARSFGVYRDALVRAILLLKYERVEPLGAWFAERLAELISTEPGLLNADVIVPVPLHRFR
jgi:predicted amidophosphoribosyltransferase